MTAAPLKTFQVAFGKHKEVQAAYQIKAPTFADATNMAARLANVECPTLPFHSVREILA